MTCVIAESTWLLGLHKELGVNIVQLVTLLSNSKKAIQIAMNPFFCECSKHIQIDCHFIRDKNTAGVIDTEGFSTKD